jgi:hypothetical protein
VCAISRAGWSEAGHRGAIQIPATANGEGSPTPNSGATPQGAATFAQAASMPDPPFGAVFQLRLLFLRVRCNGGSAHFHQAVAGR